jgi:hypothetical protein
MEKPSMKKDLPPTDTDPSNREPAEVDLPTTELDDASDLDVEMPYDEVLCTDDGDDSQWEAFIPEEDERDPLPDPGDFWVENCEDMQTWRPDRENDLVVRRLFVSPSPSLVV